MSKPCLSIPAEDDLAEPFEDRIDILFHELELATRWQRPSVLLAIYGSDGIRADADIALENRLHNLGQSAYHIKIKNQKSADVSLLISELANLNNVVFFVEGLQWNAGEDDHCTYRILNKSREFFIENQIRVVFWLTENEAIELAHFAPDYWSFRHRVIEFVDLPKSAQDSAPILESTWQAVGEPSENDDLDAKIALRVALLADLPDGSESTSARANLLLTLGVLHWRRRDHEQAHQFLNTALDLAAGLEDARFEALCFNAIALVETDLGRPEAAIQAYQNAIKLAPEQISPWNNLGNLYRKLERYQEGLAAFQKAVDQNESDAVGWNGLGDLYHELGRIDDAIYAFLKAVQASPDYAPAWGGLGNCYLEESQLDEALAAHLKVIEIDRNTIDSWLALGDIYKQQGKIENASMAYRSVLEFDPKNKPARDKLAALPHSQATPAPAHPTLRKSVDSGQASHSSYADLASPPVQKDPPADAISQLQKRIELSEEPVETLSLWNRLGDAYRNLGDYEHAMAAYRTADALNPGTTTDADAQDRASEIRFVQPEPSEPGLDGLTSLPGMPEPAFISWLDGLAAVMTSFHQHGMPGAGAEIPAAGASLEQLEKNLELQYIQPEPDYPIYTKDEHIQVADADIASWYEPLPEFTDNLSASEPVTSAEASQSTANIQEENAHLWNELGSIYMNTGAFAEAINAFEKAIELDRSYGWSYNNLAALYSRQGRYKEAIPLIQKGLQFSGDSGDKGLLWNRLGDAYRRLNQHDRAASAYRKAMELDPDNVSLLTRARFSLLGNCRA